MQQFIYNRCANGHANACCANGHANACCANAHCNYMKECVWGGFELTFL